MEEEDPITAKFQTLVESLMAKTTSEIVKVFAEVLLEIRLEISQSWSGIDELKLEESEEQSTEDVFRSEATVNFKREMEEVFVSDDVVQMPKDTTIENTGITPSSVVVHEPETSQTTPSDTSDNNQSVNSPNQTQGGQVSQTVIKRKRGRPAKSSRVTEHQKSMVEVVSKSPLQAISMVSPLQPSCSSSTLASASPNTEALALNTDFLDSEDILDEETAVDEKGIPGFHHVERLAEYLVELRNLTTMTLANQQASTIIDLWQNLDTWDKQRIVSVAQNQGRLLTSHFQSPEKEATFTPGLESTTKCDLGASVSSAQRPDCCRLLEAIFVRLCDIHCSSQKKCEGTLTQWTSILQDYRKIRGLVLGNSAVMQGTSLQLVDVNQNSLIQWHNHRIKDQGLTVLLKEDHAPSLPEVEDPLVARLLPVEPTQHQALAHGYMPPESIAGHPRLKGRDIGEPPAIRPKLSTQRELFGPAPKPAQYLQVVPHISVRAAPVLQALHVLQPMPTFVCAPPQNTIQQRATQDPSQPRQKRAYNRVVQGNTCKKCGQFRSAVTGHSQYKGIVYCPQTETLDKKQWLEKMRKKCK